MYKKLAIIVFQPTFRAETFYFWDIFGLCF